MGKEQMEHLTGRIEKKPVKFSQQSQIRFAILGDSHLVSLGYNSTTRQYVLDASGLAYRRILQRIANSNARFVIHGGDTVGKTALGRPLEEKYKAFRNVTRGILRSIPVFYTVGNWDRINLFRQYISPNIRGVSNAPGTNGRVKIVILDNADGRFHNEDINILRGLSGQYQYIIVFHWPLRVGSLVNSNGHVLSANQTNLFFQSIPGNVRNQIIAIFTHHRHSFYFLRNNPYPGFGRTAFFVVPCSGRYRCSNSGYLRITLNRQNNRYILGFNPTTDFIRVN